MSKKKVALITGITGQDGSYLAEFLLSKGYEVHGIIRRASDINTNRIDHIFDPESRKYIHYGDLGDGIDNLIYAIKPDEIYNLGSMSHVSVSFKIPVYTGRVTGVAVTRILECIKRGIDNKILDPNIKFYQASSSEMFGLTPPPQNEKTIFNPISPYGCAKLYAYHIVKTYRAQGLFAVNGILFNHESSRRGPRFVTRKIIKAACRIKLGLQDKLVLGNLDAKRDWGHSKDYCIDLDTPILTPKGWKYRNELSKGDTIINYNLKKDCWEPDIIEKFYDIPYKGNMYIFKGNNTYFKSSANHRIIYKKRKYTHKSWSVPKWKEATAQEIYNKFKDKTIQQKYQFCFPGFKGLMNQSDYSISDEMIELIGWLVTEGCLSISKQIGGWQLLTVSQSKKKYYKNLKKCLKKLRLQFVEKHREDKVVEFRFSSKSRDKILDYFEALNIHKLPNYVFSFSKRQLNILINTMMLADGSWSNSGYYSSNYKLASDFQTLASLYGYRTSLKQNKAKSYIVTLFSKAKKSRNNFITEIAMQYTKKNLWCIKAKNNGTIITKQKNSIFVSGNCRAMWMMMQHDTPRDWVVSTQDQYSIKEFLYKIFKILNLDVKKYVTLSKSCYRPNEVPSLLGDSSKIRKILGWKPKYNFDMLVREMIDFEMKMAKNELKIKEG